MDANIRIRIDSANNGDYETQTYINSTFGEAVAALQGTHEGYHRRRMVYVVATYTTDHTEHHGPKRQIERHVDEPIFGYEINVYGRDISFGEFKGAEIARGSMGSMSTDQTRMLIDLETLALNLAIAANTEPVCSKCQVEVDERAARTARLLGEA